MRQTALLIAFVVLGSTAFAADPQLLNLVMPDAKVLAGVNATNVRTSAFGQFIISKIGSSGQDFQNLTTATGFNPLQDITEVLAASPGEPGQTAGLVLVRGTFNVDKIVAAIGGRSGASIQTIGDATLITPSNSRSEVTRAIAFFEKNTIAALGDLASVNAALRRRSVPSAIDTALALKVNDASLNQDEWLVSTVPLAKLFPAGASAPNGIAGQILPVLKSVQSFSGGVKFGSEAKFTGQAVADTPENASALSFVVKLALTLLSTNAGTNPHATQLVQLLQPLQVTQTGTSVNIALTIPESQLEALANTVPVNAPSAPLQRQRLRTH